MMYSNRKIHNADSVRKGTLRIGVISLIAVVLAFIAPAAFAAGQVENTEAEREQIEQLVREYSEEAIDDEQEREAFNEEVVSLLAERFVDVQGLQIALRAFELDSEADGEEFAEYVVDFVDRTETRLRRGEPAHRAAAEARAETRSRIPEHVSTGERNRERAREIRARADERARRAGSEVPGGDGDDGPSGGPDWP